MGWVVSHPPPHSGTGVVGILLSAPSTSDPRLPAVDTRSLMHTGLAPFPSTSQFSIPLSKLPRVTYGINYLHSSLHLGILLGEAKQSPITSSEARTASKSDMKDSLSTGRVPFSSRCL